MNFSLSNQKPVLITLFLVIFISLYILLCKKIIKNNKPNLPPEIPGAIFPIGHLHKLGGEILLARTLANFANKYGPIFTIKLGTYRAIVVSNWEGVKECFTTNDKEFAARPSSSAGVYLGYNSASFGFADGPYWRKIRKFVLLEVLSSRRLEQFKHVRITEVETSIKELHSSILKSGGGPTRVNMSQWFEQLSLNVIMKMITGKRYKVEDEAGRHFTKITKEYMHVSVQFVLSDVIPIPFLRWFDILGTIKSMKRISQEMDELVKCWIDEHIMKREDVKGADDQDFIDVMLSKIDEQVMYGYTKETVIKATVLNIILAGSDTTSIHLTWLLSLLLNNKHVMDKAQEEIDLKIGKERWVEDPDINDLVYLRAIIKEALRLYPPGPLAVPHVALEDCILSGYRVPKCSRLLVNVWKLHRDPRVWTEPEKFMPERFLSDCVELDIFGQHFEYIPFGSGRRSCPGIAFAMQVTHLTLARLLQGFNFSTLENLTVDMKEGNSMTLNKLNPLEVLATPRLEPLLYQL